MIKLFTNTVISHCDQYADNNTDCLSDALSDALEDDINIEEMKSINTLLLKKDTFYKSCVKDIIL